MSSLTAQQIPEAPQVITTVSTVQKTPQISPRARGN